MTHQGPEATETPACLLCGSEGGVVVGHKARFGMPVTNLCCARCALVYVTPRPSPEQMAEYYRSVYRQHYGEVAYANEQGEPIPPSHPDFEQAMERWHQIQVKHAAQLGELRPGQQVLEIGCRQGRTLVLQREQFGIEPYGIEPGEAEAKQANASGVKCFQGTLEDYEPAGVLFDQVQLFHVLEHFHDPVNALVTLRRWLKPEGRVVIEVPNVYQPYGLLEENFFQNVHLVSFSPHTLHAMLVRAGFQVNALGNRATLYASATRNEAVDDSSLPFLFESQQLGPSRHDCQWVAQRLESYQELEKCRLVLKHRKVDPRLLRLLVQGVQRPCFVEHLSSVVKDLVTFFARGGRLDLAQQVAASAALGPHPPELVTAFAKLANAIADNSSAADVG